MQEGAPPLYDRTPFGKQNDHLAFTPWIFTSASVHYGASGNVRVGHDSDFHAWLLLVRGNRNG